MHSSTSNSSARAPEFNYPTQLFWTGLVLACLLILIAAINVFFDPFLLVREGPKADIERARMSRPQNTVLWAVAGINDILDGESIETDVAIVGDSRAVGMTGSWRDPRTRFAVDHSGRRIFNLGVAGRSVSASLTMYAHYERDLPGVETLVIVVPYDKMFGFEFDSGQQDEAFRLAASPIEYLISLRTLHYYLWPWLNGELEPVTDRRAVAGGGPPHLLPEPALHMTVLERPTGRLSRRLIRQERIVRSRIVRSRTLDMVATIQDQFRPLHEAGPDLQLLFYIAPMHPRLEEVVQERRRFMHDRMVQDLSALGQVYDGAMYDGPVSTLVFSDMVHLETAGPDLLQDALDCLASESGYRSILAHDGVTPCVPRSGLEP